MVFDWEKIASKKHEKLTVVIPIGAPAGRAHVAMPSPRASTNSKYLSMALILAIQESCQRIWVVAFAASEFLDNSSEPFVQVLRIS